MRRAHSDLRLRRMRVVRSSEGALGVGVSTRRGHAPASIGRPYLIAMMLLQAAPFYSLRISAASGQALSCCSMIFPENRYPSPIGSRTCFSGSCCPFHRDFGFEALPVAEDRRNGEDLAAAPIAQDAVLVRNVALDRDVVPFLRMPDIADRNVVVLAPEKRHGVIRQAHAEHVERAGLTLPFG